MAEGRSTDSPTGQWRMARPELLQALGMFVISWSVIESTIEVGFHKQTGLAALETSIITAGMQFRGRSLILLSLLERDRAKNKEAIRALKDAMAVADRNDILHGVAGGSEDVIWFNRRKTDAQFRSKIERYDLKRMAGLAGKCSEIAARLQRSLGVTSDEYIAFFQEAHSAASKP